MKFFKQRIDTADNIAQFNSAAPFPHVVIDNAIDPTALRALVSKYPSITERSGGCTTTRSSASTPSTT